MKNHIATLRDRLAELDQPAEIKFSRDESEVAEIESSPETEAALLKYLETQTAAVEESAIHAALSARRSTIQRTLRQTVEDEKVKRTGTGKKGDPYHYQNASTQVPDMDGVPGNQNTKNDGNDE
jgi:hypothetical protein